jgi:hypothetical protein
VPRPVIAPAVGLAERRQIDFQSGALGQFPRARQEVRVDVGLDHRFDDQPALVGEPQIAVDVALRVDEDRLAGRVAADQIGILRQTGVVDLMKMHR